MIHATEGSGSDADVDSEDDTSMQDNSRERVGLRSEMGEKMSRIFPDKTGNLSKAKRQKTVSETVVEDKHSTTTSKRDSNERADDKTSESENSVEIAVQVWDADRERRLKQTATRGVVKLFNAVNKHQKEMHSKLCESNTEAKRARVAKSVSNQAHFVDMLKHSDVRTVERVKPRKETAKEQPAWTVLRDDFMMAAKIRDWDRDRETSTNKTLND